MQTLPLDIWSRIGTTVLFVTHDIEEALLIGDRILMSSPRPARIVADIRVPLARPRTDDSTTKSAFVDIKRRCLALLRDTASMRACPTTTPTFSMTVSSPAFPLPGMPSADHAALVARLAAADASVRRVALLELADLEAPELVPSFVAALRDDPSADVRSEAARVLDAWEQPDVVDALCHALLDPDDGVRATAAHSLSELKDAASGAVLRRWADRPEPFVRTAVLRGLRELRDPDAFAPALRALDASAAAVRTEAVVVLGWLKDGRALPPLARIATADADADVRRAAVGAIGFAAAGDTAVVTALLAALRDVEWQVREEAAATLGKLRVAVARDPLVAALDDDYWQVRVRAVRALGQLRDAAAAPAVVALLAHAISNLRKEAALALGELRDRATLPALHDALDDRDPEVRKAVRIAIGQIDEASR